MPRHAHTLTDPELLVLLREGDEGAFEAIVLRYHPELHAYVTRWLGSDAGASDVLQQMFLRLWETRNTVEMPHGTRAYLYAAARGYAQRYIRDVRRSDARDARYAAEHEYLTANDDSEDTIERKELVTAAMAAVEQLPEGAREVWRLCREQGLTYQEASVILGVSVNTVKTQLSRSLRTIRRVITPLLSLLLLLPR